MIYYLQRALATLMPSTDEVMSALSKVADPELGRDIVSLRMVEGLSVEGGKVRFTLNLTTPACPLRERIERAAEEAVRSVPGVTDVEMKTAAHVYATRDYAEGELLRGVKNVIAVASGRAGSASLRYRSTSRWPWPLPVRRSGYSTLTFTVRTSRT